MMRINLSIKVVIIVSIKVSIMVSIKVSIKAGAGQGRVEWIRSIMVRGPLCGIFFF